MALVPRPSAADELRFLANVAEICRHTTSLDDLLGPVLRLMSEQLRLQRGGLGIVDRARGEVALRAAHGLTPAEVRRSRFELGTGAVGRAAATAEPVCVERVTPNTTGGPVGVGAGERSFVVVPIVGPGGVVGTLGGYRPLTEERGLRQDAAVLTIAAALLLPALQAHIDRSGETDESDGRYRPANLIGRSKAMAAVYELIDQVADRPTTVLLLGESGTGKELVAGALHKHGARSRGPFVKVNCAALPQTLIESELFGHERGAFTGAHTQRQGRFESADGGTIFLDEIGDLSPATQIKLLRVLQEREFERVGGGRPIRVDVRVIAATSRDLESMIADGSFRTDLYYRLNVFPIHLPPLRERKADILLLADHFTDVCSRSHGRHVRRIATSAIDMLMTYHWPGNVRELENTIERAVLLSRDDVILGHHLPPTLQTAEASGTEPREGLRSLVEGFERDVVLDALKSARGNMAKAARALNITERIMGLRVAKYGIEARRFRQTD